MPVPTSQAPQDAAGPPQRRKRRDGEATRERIVAAAIRLLSAEGPRGVSSVRLAEAAGIVQSGFYAHFDTVEECVLIAAERIGQRLRGPIVEGMAGLRRDGVDDPILLAILLERVLGLLHGEWQFVDLLLRYRRDPSPLGAMVRRFSDGVRDDIVEHLFVLPQPLTLRAGERPQLVPAAHLIAAQIFAAVECLAEGWAPDRVALARQLAPQIMATAGEAYAAIAASRAGAD